MSGLYESAPFLALPDRSMHPGGLRLTGRAARLAGLKAGMTAADIGCGTGATAAFLAEHLGLRVVGLERSAALLETGRRLHPGTALLPWDGGALPFGEAGLDSALLECVLSVADDPAALLEECARVLKGAGTLIVSDVVSRHGDVPADSPPTETGLSAQIAYAGFHVVTREDHTPALKTFAAALYENGGGLDACAFFGSRRPEECPRLSGLGYTLIIARKRQDG